MNTGLLFRVCRIVMLVGVISLAAVSNVFAQSNEAAPASPRVSVDDTFKKELKLVEGLKVYNKQLAEQIKAQEQAKRDINASIVDAKDLEPQVVPLMKKMLTALEQFVKADLPFHKAERVSSINELKDLMTNADASTSDRFRNIMDIYTVESEYGNTYEAYSDTLNMDGTEIEVDMLRVGRLALYYQTKDGKNSGMWDTTNKAWKQLPEDMNRHVRKAIKVAAKQIAPELMNLTINAPEGV